MTYYFTCDKCSIETPPKPVKKYGTEPLPDRWISVDGDLHLCAFCCRLPHPALQRWFAQIRASRRGESPVPIARRG